MIEFITSYYLIHLCLCYVALCVTAASVFPTSVGGVVDIPWPSVLDRLRR